MRTSSGFLVTGRSGKTRIQSLPARFTWRVIAMRAASICREVTRPGSTACIAKSPNDTSLPRRAVPRLLPFWALRYLVRLGDSMTQTPSGGGAPKSDSTELRAAVAALQHLALEDPDLDADDPVLRAG